MRTNNSIIFSQKLRVSFEKYVASIEFLDGIKLFKLSSIDFVIAKECYKVELVKFLCNTNRNNTFNKTTLPIMEFSENELSVLFEKVVDEHTLNESGIIAVNKKMNKIVGFIAFNDLVNDSLENIDEREGKMQIKKLVHGLELMQSAMTLFFKEANIDTNTIKFGEYLHPTFYTIDRSQGGKGLGVMMQSFALYFSFDLKYKFVIVTSMAKSTRVNTANYASYNKIDFKQYNMLTYRFKDGFYMEDYMQIYKEKYGININDEIEIKKLKDSCIVEIIKSTMMIPDFKVLKMSINLLFMHYYNKNIKKQKTKASKL